MTLRRHLLADYGGTPPAGTVSIDPSRGTFIIDDADLKAPPANRPPPTNMSKIGMPVVIKDEPDAFPCIHRQNYVGDTKCAGCGNGNRYMEVFACTKHTACTIKRVAMDRKIPTCSTCKDRQTGGTLLDFGAYENRYAGMTGIIVGRGPTTYHWPDLAKHEGPIFCINDAVLKVEEHAPENQDVFLHVQDLRMGESQNGKPALVENRKAISVVALGGDLAFAIRHNLKEVKKLIWTSLAMEDDQLLLKLKRDRLTLERRLYRAGKRTPGTEGMVKVSPTLCQSVHWSWYCGCEHVQLIGCGGKPEGYNKDMINQSDSPEIRVEKYARAKLDGEFVLKSLGMTFEYIGD